MTKERNLISVQPPHHKRPAKGGREEIVVCLWSQQKAAMV